MVFSESVRIPVKLTVKILAVCIYFGRGRYQSRATSARSKHSGANQRADHDSNTSPTAELAERFAKRSWVVVQVREACGALRASRQMDHPNGDSALEHDAQHCWAGEDQGQLRQHADYGSKL